MYTQNEIETSIREHLSIIFGKSDAVSASDFRDRFAALIEYATSASEPILRAETIRYQSILIYWTMIFLTLHLFTVGQFKLGDALIGVDARLYALYSVFIAAIVLIFLVKAYVDYQRSMFTQQKHTAAVTDVRSMLTVAWTRRRIQDHFWEEIFDAIGRTWSIYADAMTTTLGGSDRHEHLDVRFSNLDLAALGASPELKAEIEAQSAFLATVREALGHQEARFRQKMEALPEPAASDDWQGASRYELSTRLTKAFDESLRPWFDARTVLASEHLQQKIRELGNLPEVRKTEAMLAVLRRSTLIRRIYALLEVAAPAGFAVFSIVLFWTTRP